MGGLGNQLFQISAGLYIEKIFDKPVKFNSSLFAAEKRTFSSNSPRGLEVSDLILENQFSNAHFSPYSLRLKSKLNSKKYIWESSPSESCHAKITKNTKVVFGYFQNAEMVNAVWPELEMRLLQSAKFNSAMSRPAINQAALHMRFGDYKDNAKAKAFHGLTTNSYFKDSISVIRKNHSDINLKVFTDDIASATKTLESLELGLDYEFSKNSSAIEDFAEMAQSSIVVMSNSTFSWWSSWIAWKLRNAKIFYPRPWYANSTDPDLPIFVDGWTALKREFEA